MVLVTEQAPVMTCKSPVRLCSSVRAGLYLHGTQTCGGLLPGDAPTDNKGQFQPDEDDADLFPLASSSPQPPHPKNNSDEVVPFRVPILLICR